MRIHIVCRDLHEDKILPRLATTLAEQTGWTLSDRPDKSADLNYFQVYIDWAERMSDWHHTPIAAYFSHYEPDSPYKSMWWEGAARQMDGAILTATQYAARLPHRIKAFHAHPPVDPIFTPGQAHARGKRIGVSGYIDRHSTRKGAAHVETLAGATDYEIVASGKGWPVTTKLYPFSGLPDFYRSLDVFLCTSEIEGIPMPPLEALACGVPIVIPYGVGLLDDLPNIIGIYRYTTGNVDSMREAIDGALSADHDPATLRKAVALYTPAQWAQDHIDAFVQMLGGHVEPAVIESDRHGQRGVLYVAYGDPARKCALGAISSWKAHMPAVPVALVSDKPLGIEDVFIPYPDEDIGGRSAKTAIDDVAPKEWQYILYLDADTELKADVSFLFDVLEDGWDMVICKNPARFHSARQMGRSDNKDECEYTFNLLGSDHVMQLNGGVFAYQRNARTADFFSTWHSEWRRWGKRDQAALLRALWAHPVKLYVLGNEFNTITRYDSPDISAGILHYPMTARRWRGVIHGRSDGKQAWKAVKQFEGAG